MSLFEKNLEFFKNKDAEIYRKVKDFEVTSSELVLKDGEVVNLKLGKNNFYGKDEKEYVKSQVEDFLKNPLRLHFTNPNHCNLSPVSLGMLLKVRENYLRENAAEFTPFPVTDTGFLYLLGVGLGNIVEELLEQKLAKNYFIIEPVLEVFVQSMHVRDWEAVYQLAEDNEILPILIVGESPSYTVSVVEACIRRIGNTFVDGSYFVAHYSSWEIEETYGILMDRLKVYNNSTGFYEDELVMMTNAYENFRNNTFRMIPNGKYLRQDYPVLIVGSGPSLEYDLDIVKKLKDQAIVVSCGTTLNVLVKNGIIPDFQVEIENVNDVYRFNKKITESNDLSKTTLIATTTVQANTCPLYNDVWFYVRGALSSTMVFHELGQDLEDATPLSANPAVSAMAVLGFRNMYLFGVDCGRYVGASHHHKDSIYHELGMQEDDFNPAYGIRVQGNFGGTVETTTVLDMSRWTISRVQKKFAMNMYNASHGARIEGAVPMAADAIELQNDKNKKESVLRVVREQLKQYGPGQFIENMDFEGFVKQFDKFERAFTDCISDLKDREVSFHDIDRRVEEFWHDNLDVTRCVCAMIGGSLASMLRLGAFYGCRLQDEKKRYDYIQVFLEAYREQVLWMAKQSRTVFEDMAANKEKISSFKSYPLPTDEDYVEPEKIGVVEV